MLHCVSFIKDTSREQKILNGINGLTPIPAETFRKGSLGNFVRPRDLQLGKSQLVASDLLPPNQGSLTCPP